MDATVTCFIIYGQITLNPRMSFDKYLKHVSHQKTDYSAILMREMLKLTKMQLFSFRGSMMSFVDVTNIKSVVRDQVQSYEVQR